MMCSPESVVVFVESLHDDLPVGVDGVEFGGLAWQLFSDVFTQEDVLKKFIRIQKLCLLKGSHGNIQNFTHSICDVSLYIGKLFSKQVRQLMQVE